jgi:hypothetical protein
MFRKLNLFASSGEGKVTPILWDAGIKASLKYGVFWVVTPCGRNNPEDTILHSHRRENLKSYKASLF